MIGSAASSRFPYQEAKRRFGRCLAAQQYETKQQWLPTRSVIEIGNAHLQFIGKLIGIQQGCSDYERLSAKAWLRDSDADFADH